MRMIRIPLVASLLFFAAAFQACAADSDPLAKFGDENLVDIGFCFQKFVDSLGTKDAKTAAALIAELPRALTVLKLDKEADREKFLKSFEKFMGAQIVSSIRMAGGIGEVTYTDKSGKEQKQRMQNVGGRWKLSEL